MYFKNSYLTNLRHTVNQNLRSLRVLARSNESLVLKNLEQELNDKDNKEEYLNNKTRCSFCGSTKNITKEHVLPRWMFEKDISGIFVAEISGLGRLYDRATIPACKSCNSERLSSLEIYILQLLKSIDREALEISTDEKENIIRWLEIIDYKFEVLKAIRRESHPEHSEAKTIVALRKTFTRITIKNKTRNIHSLLLFKTTNKSPYFFHVKDEFIFIEFPKQQIALFYFFSKTFKNFPDARKEAMKIIEARYNQ